MHFLVYPSLLFAGLLFGVFLTSMLAVSKREDEEELRDLNAARIIWRGRPHPFQMQKEVCWHYTEDGPDAFPEHWQVQALQVLYEVKDDQVVS